MSKYARALLCCSVAGTLVLSACGGGDDQVATSASTASSDAKQSATTTLSSADSIGGDSADTTSPNFSGDDSGDLCSYAKKIEASSNDLLDDPANFSEDLKKFREIYKTALSKAPSEIKADLKTSFDGGEALFTLMEKYDGDYTKLLAAAETDPEVAKAVANLDDPEVAAASDRVDAYFTNVCGLDSGDDSGTATTT
jgi:hypothetical protein